MRAVIDASVGLKLVLHEEDSPRALELFSRTGTFLMPDFWMGEAANVLWLQVMRKKLSDTQAKERLRFLRENLPPISTGKMDLYPAALDIALEIGHTPYDCLYVAFALAVEADSLVTADVPFATAMRRQGNRRLSALVRLLSEVTSKCPPLRTHPGIPRFVKCGTRRLKRPLRRPRFVAPPARSPSLACGRGRG